MTEQKRTEIEAQIAEDEDVIKRFSFTAALGNPDAFRKVHDARQRVAVAETQLAELHAGKEEHNK